MNLKALQTLIEVDRVGSFAVAADRLAMTLPAVSAQMKTLEAELGLELFDRSRRPPSLTPIGREAAQRAQRIVAEVAALRSVAARPETLRGAYRVGFISAAAVRLMPRFLARAAAAHPAARIEVASGLSAGLTEQVSRGELEAAVVTRAPGAPPNVAQVELKAEPFVIAAPAAAAAWPLVKCVRELEYVRFTPTSGIGVLVDAHLGRLRLSPAAALTLDSVEAVMGCVEAAVGFAILPEPDARRYAKTAAISALSDPPLSRSLCLAVRSSGPVAAQTETLAALLR